jgi:hypothetical protein
MIGKTIKFCVNIFVTKFKGREGIMYANAYVTLTYLEHEVTNFKNSRRSSSVKSFARISHSCEMSEKKGIH